MRGARRSSWVATVAVLLLLVGWAAQIVRRVPAVAAQSQLAPTDPDLACASCHAQIYSSYKKTAMGRGSGLVAGALIPGEFHQQSSGVTYRVFARDDGTAWMSYARPASDPRGALSGEWELKYFVGSGAQGRTYLYKQGDQWFELPVNFYGRRKSWAMAPAFDSTDRMPRPLPVDANCLHCHATQVSHPLPEAPNRFAGQPFAQGGLGCSACHGDAAAHVASGGKAAVLNPARLAPAARDSSCTQCHLEGDAVVYKPGRSLAQFRAGDDLASLAVYFVRASEAAGTRRASSQYEAMLHSACKRASGDQLTCTTCHDPHSEPLPEQRVAFYRGKCLSCHTSPELARSHHPEQPDCAACHMPKRATTDISHEQETDHDIEARPAAHYLAGLSTPGEPLLPVGGMAAGDRELGLAYAQLAEKGDSTLAARARQLLLRAESGGADDEQVHVHLGLLLQLSGDRAGASREYALALRANPFSAPALTNRAVLDASSGNLAEAVRLLDRLVRADPSQTEAGLDLAFLECSAGETEQSRTLVSELAAVHPDSEPLEQFLRTGMLGGKACKERANEAAVRPR